MKASMGFVRRPFPAAAAVIGVFAWSAVTVSAAMGAAPAETGSAPVVLQATCDARGDTPTVRVRIANRGQQPTGVVLGFTADDRAQVVNSVQIVSIRPATGADESHVYVDPRHALTKPGTPWVVSIAPGGTHELELPLRDFISTMNYATLVAEVAAGARFVLEARPAAGHEAPVFTGRLETVIEPCLN